MTLVSVCDRVEIYKIRFIQITWYIPSTGSYVGRGTNAGHQTRHAALAPLVRHLSARMLRRSSFPCSASFLQVIATPSVAVHQSVNVLYSTGDREDHHGCISPADDDDVWQFSNTIEESAGAAYHGCRVLLSYSAKADDKLDEFGRLQPGAFARAALLEKYLLEHENYRTLALLSEWKPLAPPEELNGGLSAEQRLLVRQELGNWEQTYMKLEQLDGKWAITSIFKHDYDPAVVFKGSVRAGDDNPENPEDSREC